MPDQPHRNSAPDVPGIARIRSRGAPHEAPEDLSRTTEGASDSKILQLGAEEDLDRAHEQSASLEEELAARELHQEDANRLGLIEQQFAAQTQRVVELESRWTALAKSAASQAHRAYSVEAEMRRLREDAVAAGAARRRASAGLARAERRASRIESQASERNDELEERLAAQAGELEAARASAEARQREAAELASARERLESELGEARNQLRNSKATLAAREAALADLRSAFDGLVTDLAGARASAKARRGEAMELATAHQRLESELASAQTQLNVRTGQLETLRRSRAFGVVRLYWRLVGSRLARRVVTAVAAVNVTAVGVGVVVGAAARTASITLAICELALLAAATMIVRRGSTLAATTRMPRL
jgi:hypothetical protein